MSPEKHKHWKGWRLYRGKVHVLHAADLNLIPGTTRSNGFKQSQEKTLRTPKRKKKSTGNKHNYHSSQVELINTHLKSLFLMEHKIYHGASEKSEIMFSQDLIFLW